MKPDSNSELLLLVIVALIATFVVGKTCKADAVANRLNVVAGVGPDGLAITQPPAGGAEITPFYGPLVGLQYEREVYGPWSAGMLVLGGPSRQSRTYVWAWTAGYSW